MAEDKAAVVLDEDELALLEAEADVEAGGEAADDYDDDEEDGASASAAKSAKVGSTALSGRHPGVPAELRELRRRRSRKLATLKALADEERRVHGSEATEKRFDFFSKGAELFTHFTQEQCQAEIAAEHAAAGGSLGAGGGVGAARGRGGGGAVAGSRASAAASSSAAAGKRGHLEVSEKDEDEELVAEAQGDEKVVRLTKQPSLIGFGTMRDYQLEGLNWMISLHDRSVSGILADEMGLGKTLQSISLLTYLKEFRGVTGPHLVLVPKSTMGNWFKEFSRWSPTLRVLKLQGADKEERTRLVRDEMLSNKYDVIVTSFETVVIEHAAFRKLPWYYIVIDEAHRIKNEKSVLAQRVRQLHSEFRLLLTGTPLQNNLHELWALLNFLLPDLFASADDFDAFFTSGKLSDSEAVKKLHTILRPFLLRRLKADVEHSLLPKIETKLYIGMSAMQRTWYKTVLSKDVSALNAIGGTDKVRLLNILMQLRKVCNHPYLFAGAEPGPPYIDGPNLWEDSGKMTLLHKLLPKLRAQGSRVLIFSQMTRMLDILEDYCRLEGHGYCRIDGNTSGEERDRGMDEFNAPGSDKFLFLLSTRAGGLGINLYTADVVVLFDSDWNPQMDLQAMDRAHRIGQKKQVRVFRFVVENSVEEKIVERAERKLFLDAVVIQQGRLAAADKALSKGELMTMVKFGADEIFRQGAAGAGAGTGITDEDIDAILARGEERTKASTEKLKRDMAHTVSSLDKLDFSSTGGAADASLYLYGDAEQAQIAAINAGGSVGDFIEIGPRERKRTTEAVAAALSMAKDTVPGRKTGPTFRVKPPPMNEWQFYDRPRIEALFAKENALAGPRRDAVLKLKDARAREVKEQRRVVKARAAELLAEESNTLTEAEATDKAEAEWRASGGEAESAALEAEAASLQLSEAEAAEKERLLAEGFSAWGKREFRVFINACERHGRAAREAVVAEVADATERSAAEAERYYAAFSARCSELSDWDKLNERILRGEAKIKRRDALESLVADRVSKAYDPFRLLPVPYPTAAGGGAAGAGRAVAAAAAASRGFSEDEDRFLVCMLNLLGAGAWEALRIEVGRADQFRFNWFMKSRSAEELHRRCDALTRMLERDADAGGGGGAGDDAAGPAAAKRKPRPAAVKLPLTGGVSLGAVVAGAAGAVVGAKRKKPAAPSAAAAPAAAATAAAAVEPAAAAVVIDDAVDGGDGESAAKKPRL